jgi:2-phospho-L-lactate guanylyltransferase
VRLYHDRVPEPSVSLSRLHVVVPVRSLTGGKARLGEALDAEERESLILGMLEHELAVLADWGGAAAVLVVSADPGVLAVADDAGVRSLRQIHGDLNEAILQARAVSMADGATALLVLPADLPGLETGSLEHLVGAADAALAAGGGQALVAIAPADARSGTNALLLAPPDAVEPCFGVGSLENHLRAAAAAGASVQIVVDGGFGFDLDTPEDLEQAGTGRLARIMQLGARTPAEAATER